MWNNGALEGACGSRYSTLKQSVLKFLPAVEQGEKKKWFYGSEKKAWSEAFFGRGEGVRL
jgi:hypothetical protein